MEYNFKKQYSLKERQNLAENSLERYPNRVPVIIERSQNSRLPNLPRCNKLVPKDASAQSLTFSVRRELNLSKTNALFLMINNKFAMSGNSTIYEYYEKYKDPEDKLLYIKYTEEDFFG